ncbi:MAG: methylated-DNA--[protein]-cysteine S-methyltransferase [bacterium]
MGGEYSITIKPYGTFLYRINRDILMGFDWREPLEEVEEKNDPLGIGGLVKRYFNGERVDFSVVPIDESSLSPTYREIIDFVKKIPYGKIYTYKEVAERIEKPRWVRVVGNAMRNNPYPIIVPCHRVVGKGTLGGYSLGIEKKILLLKIEGVI